MTCERLFAAMLSVGVLVVGGCAAPGGPQPGEEAYPGMEPQPGTVPGQPGVETMPLGQPGDLLMVPLNDPATPLSRRVVYFEYDSSEVKPDYLDLLAEHGGFLASNPELRLRLEGHADERGSREYNIGLGEERAKAVRRLLLLHGASDRQLDTVSFGEEVPAALAHDDESWALNRRVEVVYEGQ